MLISLLMTIASFMGLFMIHYHNATVYQPQLLLAAPKVVPQVYVIPDNEFCLEPILPDDVVVVDTIEEINVEEINVEEINIDDVIYDEEVEEVQEQEQSLVVSGESYNTGSPLLASVPFLLVSTYIVLLLCVHRQILHANKEAVQPKRRRVSNQEYLGLRRR